MATTHPPQKLLVSEISTAGIANQARPKESLQNPDNDIGLKDVEQR
jgi:hypothetical protein